MPVIIGLLEDSNWDVQQSATNAFSKLAGHGKKAII